MALPLPDCYLSSLSGTPDVTLAHTLSRRLSAEDCSGCVHRSRLTRAADSHARDLAGRPTRDLDLPISGVTFEVALREVITVLHAKLVRDPSAMGHADPGAPDRQLDTTSKTCVKLAQRLIRIQHWYESP